MTGIALSGGAIRSVAHIGVLKVLERESIRIDAVAGCSGGSIVGALYCSGLFTIAELEQIALNFRWWRFLKPAWPVSGLISSGTILQFMIGLIGDMTFDDLKIPLAVAATDFITGERLIITSGSVAAAVQASSALPVVFSPVYINGRPVVDGSLSCQVPAAVLKEEMQCKTVIGVNVNANCIREASLSNIFGITYHLMAVPSIISSRAGRRSADIMIDVSAGGVGIFHFNKISLMIQRGELSANEGMKSPELFNLSNNLL